MLTDVVSRIEQDRRVQILYLSLLLANVITLLGIFLTVRIGRPRYFGMATVGFLAVGLLDVLVLVPEREGVTKSRAVAVLKDGRLAVGLLFGSVFTLFLFGRGVVYFGTVAVFLAVVLVRISVTDYRDRGATFDLAVIVAGGVLLLASRSLTVAYHAPTLDSIYHTAHAQRLASVESLEVLAPSRYDDLPLFHTVASVGIRLTGLSPRTAVAVFMAFLYPATGVAVFALFENVIDSTKTALLGTAFFIFNPAFLTWGTKSHPQSLSFVFLGVFLLLLTKVTTSARRYEYTGLAVVVSLAWVTTHHLGLAMGVFLITIPMVAAVAWSRTTATEFPVYPAVERYLVLVVVVGLYWSATGVTSEAMQWIFRYSPSASAGIPTQQFLIQLFTDPAALAAAAVPFLLDALHYVFFLALAGYGLWTILQSGPDRGGSTGAYLLITLCFLVAVLLYVPNPTWIPLRGVATLTRWEIMVLPFVLLVPALGFRWLAAEHRGTLRIVAVGVLAFAVVFASVGGGFDDPSLADAAGYERGIQTHFTEQNLAAGEFVLGHTNDTPVAASSLFPSYLSYADWATRADEPQHPASSQDLRFTTVAVANDTLVTGPGLTVIQYDAYRNSRIKVLLRNPQSEIYPADVAVYAPVSDEEVAWDTERESVVYSDGDTVIAYNPVNAADGRTS